jgi:hypothetical protein
VLEADEYVDADHVNICQSVSGSVWERPSWLSYLLMQADDHLEQLMDVARGRPPPPSGSCQGSTRTEASPPDPSL